MDIETCLIYFIDDGILAEKSPATLKGYRYSVNALLHYTKNKFLPQVITSITPDLLSKFFLEGIKIRKWNKYTHWTHYKNLNAFLNWCVKKEKIASNPLQKIPKPKLPVQSPKSLNEDEIKQVLRTVASIPSKYYFPTLRNKAVIAMIVFTGIRKSELINLRESDVNLLDGFITIESGKGNKRREIPIEELTLKPILLDYWEYRNKLNKYSQWFFNGTFSNRGIKDNKLSVSALDAIFKKLSNLCKKRIHAHKLRHSFATLFLDKTDDIYTLQQLMGHSSISTTCIYLSSSRKKKIEAISKLKLF